jgi:hypothetical protein
LPNFETKRNILFRNTNLKPKLRCVIEINPRISIGLVGRDFNVQHKIPGWDANSIGYHSDDGNIFQGKSNGEPYGPKFIDNDIIGCCVDFINKIVFFTKNGEMLVKM